MQPMRSSSTVLATALISALRRLGEAGEPVVASRLAAQAYASLRRDEPRIAERLNGAMHHLARLEAAASQPERSTPVSNEMVLDVRTDAPAQRHAMIFEAFDALAVGSAFVLVNDHDPKPLYYQLAAEEGGTFSWQYLESGPEVWRVRIGRTASADTVEPRFADDKLTVAGSREEGS
jgi:uncharacterized protein (DUF2249 family)